MIKQRKVLVVDDSALMRKLLTEIVEQDPNLKVVGAARDPYDAWDKIKTLKPDVLTLDVEMPNMDGIQFLEKLMSAHPMPVVMVSTLTERGCETTLRALEVGAIDFVSKPKLDVQSETMRLGSEIIRKVKIACDARPRRLTRKRAAVPASSNGGHGLIQSTHKVIAIGASTGGTEALFELLTKLPADSPGIVIVQHMPGGFTTSFSKRLDKFCKIRVREAQHGDRILPGLALLAPGGFHLKVNRAGASYQVNITDDPPVNRFKPSVDVMFRSCAEHIGKHTIGVILTGMGRDGADGMRALFDVGAKTIAQNEETCVVFGMPKEAISAGGVNDILPIEDIAQRVISLGSESLAAAR